jgi:hypothetical protein
MSQELQKQSLTYSSNDFNLADAKNIRFFAMASKSRTQSLTNRLAVWKPIIWRPTVQCSLTLLAMLGSLQTIGQMAGWEFLTKFPVIQWYWYVIALLTIVLGSALEHTYQSRHAYAKQIPLIEELNQQIGWLLFLRTRCDPVGELPPDLKGIASQSEKDAMPYLNIETRMRLSETLTNKGRINIIIAAFKTAIKENLPPQLTSHKLTNRT